jgi:hypothetical protein
MLDALRCTPLTVGVLAAFRSALAAPIADHVAQDVAHGATLIIEANSPTDFTMRQARLGQPLDAPIPDAQRSPLRAPVKNAEHRHVGLCGLDREVGADHGQQPPSVGQITDAPVVLRLPARIAVRDLADRADAYALLDGLNDGALGVRNRHLDTDFGQMNAALAVKEPGEPRSELALRPTLEEPSVIGKHNPSIAHPMAMGRAVADAVLRATEAAL